MAGVTSTVVKESAEELTQRIKEATTAREKDKVQVLYWLKQEKAPAIKVIAKSLGHHRNTVQTWLFGIFPKILTQYGLERISQNTCNSYP
ncbi:MAG: hypothetical protein GPJ00_09815 [Microcystis aeruginosa W13-18]|nr:hypothetical protein [Microcystis aeruginosa W13-18]